ncbi:MAG: YciI family protein [Gammaproteobacteria bacterium]|nr:MAG: YciI family protein [Gammaproteobacteria bacterium]
MNYTVLIYESDTGFALRADPDTKKREAYWSAWPRYIQALQEAGVFVSGAGLEPVHTATTLKLKSGKQQVQDGPFADTKEQLGGFFVINVPDMDSALQWASRVPAASGSVIEVRQNLVPPTH